MPSFTSDQATPFEIHGSRFSSYVAPARGSTQLCAWRLDVPAGTTGLPHVVSHEEVLLWLAGTAAVQLDGVVSAVEVGDVVFVPAGARFGVDNPGPTPAAAWVTTSVGLTAQLDDGTPMVPPWTT